MNKILVTAINKKHQAKVNTAIRYIIKYNKLNEQRNIADDDSQLKLYDKLNKQCISAFDNYLESFFCLPKREQKNIEKSPFYYS